MAGIVSYGAYVPRYRLKRMAIFQAMGWINPANIMLAQGEKAVANSDEDSLTMAAAASIDCVEGFDRSQIDGLFFASTTMPYLERQNAGIIAGALNLREDVRSADFSGALKSGTSALISALEGVGSKNARQILVCMADSRLGKMGSPQEMIFGDGGAAFLVGEENVIAEFKGSNSLTCDFVDHYRGSKTTFDRQWEDRWIRDLGFGEFLPKAIDGLLKKTGVPLNDFSKVIFQCHYDSERKSLAKILQLDPAKVQDPMYHSIGETGTAHSPLMLVRALEEANPGDKLLVVSFGQRLRCPLPSGHRPDFPIQEESGRSGVFGQASGDEQLPQICRVPGDGARGYRPSGRDRFFNPLEPGLPAEEGRFRPHRFSLQKMRNASISPATGMRQPHLRGDG